LSTFRPPLSTVRSSQETIKLRGSFASKSHEHENLPSEGSSGKFESGSSSSRNLVQDRVESNTLPLGNIDQSPTPVKQPIKKEDWMDQQISFSLSEFLKNLYSLHVTFSQLNTPTEQLTITSKRRINRTPVVMSSVQGRDSQVIHFNRIVKTDGAPCPLPVLIGRFVRLVNFMTCFHSELLKALGIDPREFPSQNAALIKWLLTEIFNPSTGFPIIGNITNQKLVEGLVKQEIENPFRTLDALLSGYFGRPEADYDPSKAACVLINYWYPSEQTHIYQKFFNDQEQFMGLLKKIYLEFYVPNS
ncbi:hypothetical protein PTTG_12498, partial [Puccinia triticina 1-1 BBBD Race 1]